MPDKFEPTNSDADLRRKADKVIADSETAVNKTARRVAETLKLIRESSREEDDRPDLSAR